MFFHFFIIFSIRFSGGQLVENVPEAYKFTVKMKAMPILGPFWGGVSESASMSKTVVLLKESDVFS